jgi:hypothetical protein
MRVTSQLVDVDLEVGHIRREGSVLIVRSAEGIGIPTEVGIHPRDAVQMLKAVLCSRGALTFILLLPFLYWRTRKQARPATADMNNPWSGV